MEIETEDCEYYEYESGGCKDYVSEAEDCDACGCEASEMEYYANEEVYKCPNCGSIQNSKLEEAK